MSYSGPQWESTLGWWLIAAVGLLVFVGLVGGVLHVLRAA